MSSHHLTNHILNHFEYEPTSGQATAIDELSDFVCNGQQKSLFVLKGYAGTGKTTLISALIRALPHVRKKTVLIAPTGRAAKVLAGYSRENAFTIHKEIYYVKTAGDSAVLTLKQNKHTQTIFICDEASMISSGSTSSPGHLGDRSLLDDLLLYVYGGNDCKLILVGDTAQLPPVGLTISPALDSAFLQRNYSLEVSQGELTEVTRQDAQSGILMNATALRRKISKEEFCLPLFSIGRNGDIRNIPGSELEDTINTCYSRYGTENTMIITRSNKSANLYNQEIRRRILFQESEISAGDLLMVLKNNYFWLPDNSKAGFIANGDILEVSKVGKTVSRYGFSFADVTVRLIDYPDEPELEIKLMLDTIHKETPSLPYPEQQKLYQEVMQDYMEIQNKGERYKKIKQDPWLNALQVKFAYALTCHKTQGGQWDTIFIDLGYLKNDMLNKEFLRWLYTATTRAVKLVYLINFREDFYCK